MQNKRLLNVPFSTVEGSSPTRAENLPCPLPSSLHSRTTKPPPPPHQAIQPASWGFGEGILPTEAICGKSLLHDPLTCIPPPKITSYNLGPFTIPKGNY